MRLPNFCGPSDVRASWAANNERTVNLFTEFVKRQERWILLPTPGLSLFASVGSGPIRGKLACADGNDYVVSRNQLYRVTSAGAATLLGSVSNTSSNPPVSMAASATQLLVISNGLGYVYNFNTGVFAQIADADFPASVLYCGFSDGYFIVLTATAFFLSANNDATNWDALDFGSVASSANTNIGMGLDHRQLIIFGDRITQVFNNTGAEFPYEADPNGIIQMGLLARFSVARLDNTTFFLGQNENGQAVVYKFDRYTPIRVSDHDLEAALQGYSTLSDAVAFAFQYQGHLFYRITFPTAGRTWEYDVVTESWHELTYLSNGTETAHLGICYSFAFGRHLVGSRVSSNIYELSSTTRTDNGDPIQRIRRCPIPSDELKRAYIDRFEVAMQTAAGLNVGSGTLGYDPVVQARMSWDGGNNWGSYRDMKAGRIGEFGKRPYLTRMGSGHRPVVEILSTDPVFWAFTDAYIEGQIGLN